MSPPPFEVAFRRLFVLRLVGTVSLRFAYPFLATISSGLGTGIGPLGLALACGEAAGLLGPFIGRRLDRIGRRRGMVDGLIVCAAGCTLVSVAPHLAVFAVGIFTVSVGRCLFDVSLGAWIGDEVPFERRGRASGLGELAWSGAFLLGVPVAGLLMTVTSWRMPYLLSALLLAGSVPVVRATVGPPAPEPAAAGGAAPAPATAAGARLTPVHLVVFAASVGAALIFVTQGAWFQQDLGLSERSISLAVGLLGVGEVAGTLLAARFADRIGKRRTMAAGLALLLPSVAAVALVGTNQIVGVLVVLMVGLSFELAFVSALPLVVEVPANRRAGALSLAIAAVTTGRTVAALAGPAAFAGRGMHLVVLLSAPCLLLAIALVATAVREPAQLRAPTAL